MSAAPYIGSRISLISKANIRYEGTLYGINAEESTVMLSNVRSFGTEGRAVDGKEVLARPDVFEYIVFRGNDIKDLHVQSEAPANKDPASSLADSDPAVLRAQPALQQQQQQQQQAQPPSTRTATEPAPGLESQQPKSYSSAVHQSQPPQQQQQQQQQQQHGNRQQYQLNQYGNGYNRRDNNNNNNSSSRGGRGFHNSGNYTRGGGGGGNRSYSNQNTGPGLLATPSVGLAGSAPNQQGGKFEGDFDFEGANAKLNKEDMEREFLDKLKLKSSDDGAASAGPNGSLAASSTAPASSGDSEVVIPPPAAFYNPQKSFFDSISCEVSDRQKESPDGKTRKNWAQERQVNSETFGTTNVQHRRPNNSTNNSNYRGNNYNGNNGGYRPRGRGGNYGGRGGYRSNYNSNSSNNNGGGGGSTGGESAPTF